MRVRLASLRQYVELVAQAPGGGLRDKPGKSPDAYHTCYNLSGASSAACHPVFSRTRCEQLAQSFQSSTPAAEGSTAGDSSGQSAEEITTRRRRQVYSRSLAWQVEEPRQRTEAESENALVRDRNPSQIPSEELPDAASHHLQVFTHPLFNVCMPAVQAIMGHFYGQGC